MPSVVRDAVAKKDMRWHMEKVTSVWEFDSTFWEICFGLGVLCEDEDLACFPEAAVLRTCLICWLLQYQLFLPRNSQK